MSRVYDPVVRNPAPGSNAITCIRLDFKQPTQVEGGTISVVSGGLTLCGVPSAQYPIPCTQKTIQFNANALPNNGKVNDTLMLLNSAANVVSGTTYTLQVTLDINGQNSSIDATLTATQQSS